MTSLTKRILTSAIGIPLLVLLFYWGGFLFYLLVLAVGLAALFEYRMLWCARGISCTDAFLYLGGAALITGAQYFNGLSGLALIFIFAVLSLCWLGIRGTWTKYSNIESVGLMVLGLVYIAWPISLLLPLREQSLQLVLFLFALSFGSDTAAYFVGMNFGRRRLAPTISPKKSWEGAIGALIFTGFLSALWISAAGGSLAIWQGFAFGVILSAFGQVGDLIESMLKRYCGVKDSGKILPGHGGMLDRIDSLLLTIPLMYLAARMLL